MKTLRIWLSGRAAGCPPDGRWFDPIYPLYYGVLNTTPTCLVLSSERPIASTCLKKQTTRTPGALAAPVAGRRRTPAGAATSFGCVPLAAIGCLV